jgi:RNA polymerase sigma factor (sigma-70 family)
MTDSCFPIGALPPRFAAISARTERLSRAETELCTFWRTHRGALRRHCEWWTRGQAEDADDLLGEALLRVLEALRCGTQHVVNRGAWWSAVISNLARDRLRERARRGLRLRVEHDAESAQATLDPGPSIERVLDARRELAATLSLLRRVPAAQRRALVARGEGHDYSLIALELGTSSANARKLVQLGRDKLRAGLARARISRPSNRKGSPPWRTETDRENRASVERVVPARASTNGP